MSSNRSYDWRVFFDKELLGAWDFPEGKDVTLTMTVVKGGELGHGKTKTRKPILYFERTKKGFALNATNGKTIAALYGNDTRKWAGQKVTLYPTTTSFGGSTVDCIRVRNRVPSGAAQEMPDEPPQREPGDDADQEVAQ